MGITNRTETAFETVLVDSCSPTSTRRSPATVLRPCLMGRLPTALKSCSAHVGHIDRSRLSER